VRDREARLTRGLLGGLGASVPIEVGYLPAGIAFGVAARQAGLVPAEATLMSLIVYSGSSQFALLGLLAAGASWAAMLIIPLVLSLRHLLYGPGLAPRLRGVGTWRAAVVAFGLDDEVFAVSSVKMPRENGFGWILGLELGAYVSWALGTLVGGITGTVLIEGLPSLVPAFSFALPALFVALLVPLVSFPGVDTLGRSDIQSTSSLKAAAVAAGAVATLFRLTGLGSWGVMVGGVAGPVCGLLLERLRRRRGSDGG
jgi:4-azaleucine resistance transporter AzlC